MVIDSEVLHAAADKVTVQAVADGGFTDDAIDRFLDESKFLADFGKAREQISVERGSLAYGIAIGVEAARLVAELGTDRDREMSTTKESRDDEDEDDPGSDAGDRDRVGVRPLEQGGRGQAEAELPGRADRDEEGQPPGPQGLGR